MASNRGIGKNINKIHDNLDNIDAGGIKHITGSTVESQLPSIQSLPTQAEVTAEYNGIMGYMEELALSKRKVHSFVEYDADAGGGAIYQFSGACVVPSGKVIFVPFTAQYVGIFDPQTNIMTNSTQDLTITQYKWQSGVYSNISNEVVFVPNDSDDVISYNWENDTITTIDTLQTGSAKYTTCCEIYDGRIIFAPFNQNDVGIFTPNVAGGGVFSTGDTVTTIGSAKYAGASLASNGTVIFAPHDAEHIGIYNPETDTFTEGVYDFGAGDNKFTGSVALPNGDILFVPSRYANVGLYTPSTDTYRDGTLIPEDWLTFHKFGGGTLMPNGLVIFTSSYANKVGLYDYKTDTFSLMDFIIDKADGNWSYRGSALLPNGDVVFAPYARKKVGIYRSNIEANQEIAFSRYIKQH